SHDAPAAHAGPQWAQQTPGQGAAALQSAPFTTHPFTATQTGTGVAAQSGSGRGSTMIPIALGAVSALVLGVIVAIALLLVFDGSSAAAPLEGTTVSSGLPSTVSGPGDGAGHVLGTVEPSPS